MKRFYALILVVVLLLFAGVPALADTETVELVVSLIQSQLPADTADSSTSVYYSSSADAVILDWKMIGFDSETVITYAPLLKQETKDLFDSVAEVTSAMKNLLETFDCPQSALAMIRTKDGLPIAVFLNGAEIYAI